MLHYRSWAKISLSAIVHNYEMIKTRLAPGVMCMGVVKADGYGHGMFQVSDALLAAGVDYLGVATMDEGVLLRSHHPMANIFLLGPANPSTIPKLVQYGITATVFDLHTAQLFSQSANLQNVTAKVHVKIDTGMSRLGFPWDHPQTIADIVNISKLPRLFTEGIFTHFAAADDSGEDDFTNSQFQRFEFVVNKLKENGVEIPIRHCCNSAATMRFPSFHLDMVRPGLALYGISPVQAALQLQPAMSLETSVAQIREIEAGTTVGYNRAFTAKERMKLAVLPIGYADGLNRALSGRLKVFVNDCYAQIIGIICMDQCMIDVTNVQNIEVGDVVTIFGSEKNAYGADYVAGLLDTISYEVLCDVGKRVPRSYGN